MLPPLKKSKLRKKQREGNKINRRLTEANQEWCDWKFQIHWNKIERVNPRSRDESKNSFYVSSTKKIFKDNNKPAHWVGYSNLRSLDIDELFKIAPNFDEKKASVGGAPEEEENIAQYTTYYADTNAEDNVRIHKN